MVPQSLVWKDPYFRELREAEKDQRGSVFCRFDGPNTGRKEHKHRPSEKLYSQWIKSSWSNCRNFEIKDDENKIWFQEFTGPDFTGNLCSLKDLASAVGLSGATDWDSQFFPSTKMYMTIGIFENQIHQNIAIQKTVDTKNSWHFPTVFSIRHLLARSPKKSCASYM